MIIDNTIATSGSQITVVSPYSGDEVGQVTESTLEDVSRAVNSAYRVFHERAKYLTPFERYEILFKVYEEIKMRQEQIAGVITNESGKVIRESRAEVQRALSTILYAAEEAKRIHGRVLPCDITAQATGKIAYVHRKPIGVIAAITPFNFPLNTVVHKVAPAIAAGNAVVLKPSSRTPLTAEVLGEIFVNAGLPPGVFNIVQGSSEIGEALVMHPLVRMVSLTGSVAVGQRVSRIAGIKKLILELGGNDPLIVCADGDLGAASNVAVEQGLGTCGQRCTAVKRIFVERTVLGKFLDVLKPKVKALRIGDPLDSESDIGPMISESAAKAIEKVMDEALRQGARRILGGRREKAILPPVIIDQIPDGCRLVQEETFGPVLPVMPFDSLVEVIEKVNGTVYGLQAGVFTQNLTTVKKLFNELEVGTLIVNGGPGFRVESIPFGGVKDSGLGREGIISAVQEMSEETTLVW